MNEAENITSEDRYIIASINVEDDFLNELRYGEADVVGETTSGIEIPKSAVDVYKRQIK